jgi:hypothetical protein
MSLSLLHSLTKGMESRRIQSSRGGMIPVWRDCFDTVPVTMPWV